VRDGARFSNHVTHYNITLAANPEQIAGLEEEGSLRTLLENVENTEPGRGVEQASSLRALQRSSLAPRARNGVQDQEARNRDYDTAIAAQPDEYRPSKASDATKSDYLIEASFDDADQRVRVGQDQDDDSVLAALRAFESIESERGDDDDTVISGDS
jgi:hypothetical protein